MPDMPQSISKGALLTRIDKFSKNPDNLRAILPELEARGDTELVAILDSHNLLAADEKLHLANDWFNATGQGWWLARQPIQPIINLGFIEAIKIALDKRDHDGKPLALDCFWVCSTGHNDHDHHDMPGGMPGAIEVGVMWSDCCVTVLLHTPGGGPAPAGRILDVDEPIKVIAKKDGNVQVFDPKTHKDEMPALVGGGAGGPPSP